MTITKHDPHGRLGEVELIERGQRVAVFRVDHATKYPFPVEVEGTSVRLVQEKASVQFDGAGFNRPRMYVGKELHHMIVTMIEEDSGGVDRSGA